jgi:hypothetical protein
MAIKEEIFADKERQVSSHQTGVSNPATCPFPTTPAW